MVLQIIRYQDFEHHKEATLLTRPKGMAQRCRIIDGYHETPTEPKGQWERMMKGKTYLVREILLQGNRVMVFPHVTTNKTSLVVYISC